MSARQILLVISVIGIGTGVINYGVIHQDPLPDHPVRPADCSEKSQEARPPTKTAVWNFCEVRLANPVESLGK